MSFFILFMIWYAMYGKNNPKIYRSLEDKLGMIFMAFIAFSVFSSFIPSFLAVTMIGLFLLLPFGFIGWVLAKVFGKGKKGRQSDYTYYQNHYSEQNTKKQRAGMSVTNLTRAVPKRRRIISRFSKKYNLNLTDKEIDRIVDASYISYCWEREVYEMDKEYDVISQWYSGDSGWLRAYLHVFPVQSVSSDFEMQRQICMDSFTQVFDDMNPGSYTTIDDCVDAINNKYFTAFDETTFMIAYRFLEAGGRKYEMPNLGVLRNESELDRLRRKYDGDSGAAAREDGTRVKI